MNFITCYVKLVNLDSRGRNTEPLFMNHTYGDIFRDAVDVVELARYPFQNGIKKVVQQLLPRHNSLDYGVVLHRQSETSTKCSCIKTSGGYVSSLKEI